MAGGNWDQARYVNRRQLAIGHHEKIEELEVMAVARVFRLYALDSRYHGHFSQWRKLYGFKRVNEI